MTRERTAQLWRERADVVSSRHRLRRQRPARRWLAYVLAGVILLGLLVAAGMSAYGVLDGSSARATLAPATVPPSTVAPPPRCPPGFHPYFTENGPRVCVRPVIPTTTSR